MGYYIVYDRQFIKTKTGHYLPMVLLGDSNWTEGHGKNERVARSWSSLTSTNPMTEKELLEHYTEIMDNHMEDFYTDKEDILWGMGFRIQGKKTYDDLLNWLKTSCKKAITFEQLVESGNKFCIEAFHDYDDKLKVEDGDVPFNKWYDSEEEFITDLTHSKGRYKFLYFTTNWGENFGKEMRKKYFPIKRKQKVRRDVDEFYTIKVSIEDTGFQDMYLKKHTSRSTKMDYVPYLKYLTEAEAQKVVNRYNKKYGPRKTYKVEKVERPATILA